MSPDAGQMATLREKKAELEQKLVDEVKARNRQMSIPAQRKLAALKLIIHDVSVDNQMRTDPVTPVHKSEPVTDVIAPTACVKQSPTGHGGGSYLSPDIPHVSASAKMSHPSTFQRGHAPLDTGQHIVEGHHLGVCVSSCVSSCVSLGITHFMAQSRHTQEDMCMGMVG